MAELDTMDNYSGLTFKAWRPLDFEEWDAGPCGRCNYYGCTDTYRGFEVYVCKHGSWWTDYGEEAADGLCADSTEVIKRMSAAGPNLCWGDMLMDDEEEVLSKESPEAKAARLAAVAEKERREQETLIKDRVLKKEGKWNMSKRNPRPCEYATLFKSRVCASCLSHVPEGQGRCSAKALPWSTETIHEEDKRKKRLPLEIAVKRSLQGLPPLPRPAFHMVCGQELAGCWNHDQHRTCIFVHPDEPQWNDAVAGKLCYDVQSMSFHLRGQEPQQPNRFQVAARAEQPRGGGHYQHHAHSPLNQQRVPVAGGHRVPNQRPPPYGGPRQEASSDGWEAANRNRRGRPY
jgi:hypothetical protein